MQVLPEGPIPAKIFICGEAPGADEERLGTPFVGASGQELNRMLQEAGIMRSECFISNVCRVRPPGNDISAFVAAKKKDITPKHVLLRDKYVLPVVVEGYNQLLSEIALVKPNVIVAVGNIAMWALTGKWGIMKQRGSLLRHEESGAKCIPTLHPAYILRSWSDRVLVVNDLKRVKDHYLSREYDAPKWNFIIRPSFETVVDKLNWLIAAIESGSLEWIDFDFETKHGHIDCAGISWSRLDALCIPFMSAKDKDGYWLIDEEAAIVHLLYRLLTHPKVKVRGQNMLYDAQYSFRWWHFIPRVVQDTMIAHHVCFAGLKKSLDFQASMYTEFYQQWKPEKSAWKDGG